MTIFRSIDDTGKIVSSGRVLMVQHSLHKFHNSIARGVNKLRWDYCMRTIFHLFDTPLKLVLHCEYFEVNIQESVDGFRLLLIDKEKKKCQCKKPMKCVCYSPSGSRTQSLCMLPTFSCLI